MRKRLLTFAAIASALCCVLVVGLTVRSFRVCEEFGFHAMNQYGITSNRGVLRYYCDARFEDVRSPADGSWTTRQDPTSVPSRFVHYHRAAGDIGDRLLTEFNVEHHHRRTGLWVSDMVIVTVPHWFVAAILAILPTWWIRRTHRERVAKIRRASGCCPACGYDLRATPGRCPECGGASLVAVLLTLGRA